LGDVPHSMKISSGQRGVRVTGRVPRRGHCVERPEVSRLAQEQGSRGGMIQRATGLALVQILGQRLSISLSSPRAGHRRSRKRGRSPDRPPPPAEVRTGAPRSQRRQGSLPGECLRRGVGRSRLRLPCSTCVAGSFSGGHDPAGSRHPDVRSAPRVRIPQHSSKLPTWNGRGSSSLYSEAR
jgi:hypothetical protein